jgi:small subunit ribosomal protein S20
MLHFAPNRVIVIAHVTFPAKEVDILPNIKSAKKRVLVSRLETQRNRAARSNLRTTLKKFDVTILHGDKPAVEAAYRDAIKTVDKAAARGLIHKNNAAHKKSALALRLNALAK